MPAVVMTDNFNRSVSNNWGTASGGGVYDLSGVNSGFQVDGSIGTMTSSTGQLQNVAGVYPGQFEGGTGTPDGGFEIQDSDLVVKIKMSITGVGGADHEEFDIRLRCLRGNPTDNFYRFRFRSNQSDGRWQYRFAKSTTAGGQVQLGAGFSDYGGDIPAADEWWWARAQAEGDGTTTLRLRLWKDGTSEPGTWVSITDTEATLQDIGGAAVGTVASEVGVTFSFDDLTITDLAASESSEVAVLLLGGL